MHIIVVEDDPIVAGALGMTLWKLAISKPPLNASNPHCLN
jgi:hypothetical protein